MMKKKAPFLLIGPLPPPYGGARVSFKIFFDYLKQRSSEFHFVSLPINRTGLDDAIVDHNKTFRLFLKTILAIPYHRSVVIFGSRNFCFSYGIIAILVALVWGKRTYIRFFGGQPAARVFRLPSLPRMILFTLLNFGYRFSMETQTGASMFPRRIQQKIQIIKGYRKAPLGSFTRTGSFEANKFRFVYTGLMSKNKGVDLLIKAFNKLSEEENLGKRAELHLFGPFAEGEILKIPGDSNIIYHGLLPQEQLLKRLPEFDAFVFPTVYDNEGHSGAVIEAILAGVPVLASDLPVLREILHHRVNALLFEPTESQLMDCLRICITKPELIMSLKRNALALKKEFDANFVVPQLLKVFDLA